MLVWDQEGEPPAGSDAVLCWRSFTQRDSIRSVPRYVEEHAEALREKYVRLVEAFGEHCVAGKRVIEHLQLPDGFSLWWMTLIAEKSPLKSPRVYDCVRMIALREMLAGGSVSELTLVSADRTLAQALRALCESLRIGFRAQMKPLQGSRLRRLYQALPAPLQALLSLRHVLARWPLRRLQPPPWFDGDGAVFFSSYFVHLDAAACSEGRFHSRHWESLPALLHEAGLRSNWLQLFLQSTAVPDAATGLAWVRGFNRDPFRQGRHAFLESYVTPRIVMIALGMWLRLLFTGLRLRDLRTAHAGDGSPTWLWPLLRADWRASLYGAVALENCLWLLLFDAALARVPRQATGLFLYENQAWEKAFLRAWRRHGHGRILGVQHSTAPFWYLPYTHQPLMPAPDTVVVNGRAAKRALESAGHPTCALVEVEALRFLGLAPLAATGRRREPGPSQEILILGEIAPASMRLVLNLLDECIELLPQGFRFTFKPHPSHSPDLGGLKRLRPKLTTAALAEILPNYDAVVASNSTSASIDALVAGLPVIIALDGGVLNMSPLRGHESAQFVSTPRELANALQNVRNGVAKTNEDARHEFYHLDVALPRWRRLLAVPEPAGAQLGG